MLCSVGFIIVRRVRLIIGPSKQLTFWLPEFSTKTKWAFKIPHRFVKKKHIKKSSGLSSLQKGKRPQKAAFSGYYIQLAPQKNPRLVQVSLESLMVNHDLGRQNDEENRTGAKPERFGPKQGRLRGGYTPRMVQQQRWGWGVLFLKSSKRDLTGDNILGWIRITTTLPVQRPKHSAIGNILPLKQGSWNIRLRGEQAISKCMVFFRDFSWKVRCLGW